MKGEIRIIDRKTGDKVATLEWEGTLWRGTGKWKANAATRKRLDAIVASRADLGRVSFGDMLRDGLGVKGWQGFSGWFQALSQALPAFGLDVENETVVWPWKEPRRDAADGDDDGDDEDLDLAGGSR